MELHHWTNLEECDWTRAAVEMPVEDSGCYAISRAMLQLFLTPETRGYGFSLGLDLKSRYTIEVSEFRIDRALTAKR